MISNLEYGGAQRQVIELANSADPKRLDVQVCSLSPFVPLADDLCDRERRLYVIPKRFKFDASVVSRLVGILRRLKVDIVQSYLFDADIAVRLAGRLAGTSLVVGTERNANYHLKTRQLAAYRVTRGFVDLVIANSRAGAAFNERVLGQEPSLYRVVHNGVNADRFAPRSGRAARAELGIDAHDRVVGMFGSFKRQKNHPLFFAAVKRVLARDSRVRFLLVGDELYGGVHGSRDYKAQVHQLVDDLGVRERCLFLGNRHDVSRLYCACDVTVVPSLFEGTPNVALESMACGVPVVATDVSDNALIIPEGRAGYVVPLDDEQELADCIWRVLCDPGLRQRMGRDAREWVVENFSSARLTTKTETVYRDALAATP